MSRQVRTVHLVQILCVCGWPKIAYRLEQASRVGIKTYSAGLLQFVPSDD